MLVNRAPEGKEKISTLAIDSLGTELVQRKEGNIAIGDNCYYFSCIDPDPSLDVHFLLFHPKDDEFDFSYNFRMFQQQMVDLVHQLDLDRRSLEGIGILVLWLLLLRLSKKITRPIITLAGALPHVKRAEWDQIQLPDIPFQKGKKKDNEIVMLYDSFHDMVNGMKEKEKVTGILNKVVSPEIAREILKGNISLGGEDRVVSMLFVDIRGFTKLTQDMPPHEVITLLNSCMTRLAAIVEKHGGVIDKFLGDGLMALYGAPVASVEHARNAIRSGLEMIASIKLWNQERQAMQAGPIFIGVGVHAGPVCVGNMGAQDRLNYTVIGSHVNLASRLCSSAEPSALLITEDTKKEPGVAEGFSFEDRGLMSFKGFDQPKHVLQVKQEL
ncbi:MAG: adenylate/guanylate cyclase domain-containing protein [Chlamydiae bacterium]|nr:adenylate/guanylate cyclase domain-containing protein [Chlamydiota bacterium]